MNLIPDPAAKTPAPQPEWLKHAPVSKNYHSLKRLARSLGLHTVQKRHLRPRRMLASQNGDIHDARGDILRRWVLCAVPKGPSSPSTSTNPAAFQGIPRYPSASSTLSSPASIAMIAWSAVLASSPWASNQVEVRRPAVALEVLIPDFQGDREAISRLSSTRSQKFSNIATRNPFRACIDSSVRVSLMSVLFELARYSKELRHEDHENTGVMVGLGEETRSSPSFRTSRQSAATSSPSASTCALSNLLLHGPPTRLANSPSSKLRHSAWASATSNPDPSSDPATTPTSKPPPRPFSSQYSWLAGCRIAVGN